MAEESVELTRCREAWRAQRLVLNDCRSWLLGRLEGTTGRMLLAAIDGVLGQDTGVEAARYASVVQMLRDLVTLAEPGGDAAVKEACRIAREVCG